jgi:hypothetical protein
MTIEEKQRIAVSIARKYIGEREIPNNQGFIDAVFQQKIEVCGWNIGQAWCAYFFEMVMKEAYPELFADLDKLCNASAVVTYRNFLRADKFICNKNPLPGCGIVWQTYKDNKPFWTGHMGIVDKLLPEGNFYSIEGNSNSQGGREGIEVATKLRTLKFEPTNKPDELVLLGFIKLKYAI